MKFRNIVWRCGTDRWLPNNNTKVTLNLFFSSAFVKNVGLLIYLKQHIYIYIQQSWQWSRPKRPWLSLWSWTFLQSSLDLLPQFLWYGMCTHNQNVYCLRIQKVQTGSPMAPMQVSIFGLYYLNDNIIYCSIVPTVIVY